MEKTLLSVPDQIKVALDGRTNRWLALEVKIPESELSRKMNGKTDFTAEELSNIETRLNFKIKK